MIEILVDNISVVLTVILCVIVSCNIILRLRTVLPIRVNCWFCNENFWVRFPARNCWTCPSCCQYNGFTKNGDYNKPICQSNEAIFKTPKPVRRSPAKNGLCKMCNINQQLKVAQLAIFVPMNENNFDEEVDAYRLQLEKAYKLCNTCRKVLKIKLHKEKESLLGSKLLEKRTPEKKGKAKDRHSSDIAKQLRNVAVAISVILLLLITTDTYNNIVKFKMVSQTVSQAQDIFLSLAERLFAIVKIKTYASFPTLEAYEQTLSELTKYVVKYSVDIKRQLGIKNIENINEMTQKVMGGAGCLIQIISHIFNAKISKYTALTDVLWCCFILASIAYPVGIVTPAVLNLLKFLCAAAVFMVHKSWRISSGNYVPKPLLSPKRMKNLVGGKDSSANKDDDSSSLETDDDVSLSKFGICNYSDSSNDTSHGQNHNAPSGRAFSPRFNHSSLWSKPNLNSAFSKSPYPSYVQEPFTIAPQTVFMKPDFNSYQKSINNDSDSDLDESISCLHLGAGPKKPKTINKGIFSVRKFNAVSPSFLTPMAMPLSQARPLISPSKLGQGTSWVAGGYWGCEGNRHIFNLAGSRSSSQSSGFESQTSSLNQRNVFSQPPSREESVCSESDRTSLFVDRCQNSHYPNNGFNNPNHTYYHPNTKLPVHPHLRYDSHIHIPQPRLGHSMPAHTQSVMRNYDFSAKQQPMVQNHFIQASGGSGLIKLPDVSS